MKAVSIAPIGTVDAGLLDSLAQELKGYFSCSTRIEKNMTVLEESFDIRRGQYLSTPMLEMLQRARPGQSARILGVIDRDLFVPRLNFVFGEASIFGGAAIIALPRLRQEFYGLPSDRDLFTLRALKEAIHELGHTFGLDHCGAPMCIMHFSNSLADTDIKGPGFCGICGERLGRRLSMPHK